MAEVYSSNSKANLGVTLGAIGTGLALFSGHGGENGWGLFGGGNNYVTKETAEKESKISELQSALALKEAEADSEKKMIDVYERVSTRILALERQVADNAASQGVINAQLMSGQSVLQSQVAQLMSLTKLVVPNSSCCPGWGDVTIKPAQ